MAESLPPSSETTLAILLGASAWPDLPSLKSSNSETFANSARDFIEYLSAADGLSLPQKNLLNFFDDDRALSLMNRRVVEFLDVRIREMQAEGKPARDLLVVYIGHGGFVGPESEYFFALRSTWQDGEGTSGWKIADLALTLNNSARFLRRYLILDACFSALAYKDFQSGRSAVAVTQTIAAFPKRGTALLCSAGPITPSQAPTGALHTMFMGAVLNILRKGHPESPAVLSLSDLGDAVRATIFEQYPDKAVRPEVHSPNQQEGDVAKIPLFPNPAFNGETKLVGPGEEPKPPLLPSRRRWVLGGVGILASGLSALIYSKRNQVPDDPKNQTQSAAFNTTAPSVPNIGKSKRKLEAISASDLLVTGGEIQEQSPFGWRGYFGLKILPIQMPYARASVSLKKTVTPNYFASVRMAAETGTDTLELMGLGVYFLVNSTYSKYLIYESEENQTPWKPINIIIDSRMNTLGIHQQGRQVHVFLNSTYVDSFTLWNEPSTGSVGLVCKANPRTGGVAAFQRLAVWEF